MVLGRVGRLVAEAERDAVVAYAGAGEDAGCVVVYVGVGVRFGALEDLGVVDGPLGRVARRAGRPLAAAAVLVAAEPGTHGDAADDRAARLHVERARAVNGLGAAGGYAPVRADLVFRAAGRLGDVDEHRQVGTVDHRHVVEIQVVPGVEVDLGEGRRDRAPALAPEPVAAVARLAVPDACAVEDAPGAAPEAGVQVVRRGDRDALPGGQHPAGGRERRVRVRRGRDPDGLRRLVDERHAALVADGLAGGPRRGWLGGRRGCGSEGAAGGGPSPRRHYG